ncbi:MAG: tetratricopeptide repeat protein, partial [Cyanobacteria bacterium P01_F01_bin.143]
MMDKSLEAQNFLDVNQQSFDELLTFVDFAEGFTIGFAENNFPAEAEIIIDFLQSHSQCEQIQLEILNFPDPDLRFLRDEIVKILPTIERDPNQKLVLILRGLEKSIGVFGDYPPMLADLNFVRDAYSTSVPHPILFILPDYAVTRVAKFAPDFWAWKSGMFRFQTTQIHREQEFNRFQEDKRNINQKLRLPEKQDRIDLLERLLQEYRPSGQTIAKENIKTCINLLCELGGAYLSRRKFIRAREYYQQALNIKIEYGDRHSQASTYHQLGIVTQELREYETAREYYQQALDIDIEYGDRYEQAATHHQLGYVAQNLREYETAREYYQQALDIKIEYGDRYEQASTYHELGRVAQQLREYEIAREYYQQALDIKIEFGDRYFQASTYHQLGRVAQDLREYETAREYYQQTLDIDIEYGDRYSQASTYHQLGIVAQELREYETAREYYQQALDIKIEFG